MAVKPNFKHNLGKLSGPSHFDESYQADEEGIVNACITRASNALCAQMTIQQLYALPGLQFNRDSQITLEWPLSEYRAPDAWKDWKQVCGNFKVAAEQLARAYRFGDIRGEELQAVGRSHVHTASGTLVHLWESPAAARRFARGWKHIWRALFEHSIRGIHAPLSVLIEIEGRFVSLTALLPVGAGPTTSLPNGAGPQDTMLGTQAQHLVNGLFLPAGTSVELHLGHDGRHYLLSTREATVQRLQTHNEDVMVRFEASKRLQAASLNQLVDACANALVSRLDTNAASDAPPLPAHGGLVEATLHSHGVNMVMLPAVYDAVKAGTFSARSEAAALQALQVEMIGRLLKNFIRIDIARNDRSVASRLDAVNRVVKLFVKKDADFWHDVVAPMFEIKYKTPLFFKAGDVHSNGILKLISISLGVVYEPDEGRFAHFLPQASITLVGHDDGLGSNKEQESTIDEIEDAFCKSSDPDRDVPLFIQMIAHRTEDPEAGIPIPTSLAALRRMAGRAGIVPTANENFVALSKAVLKLAVVAPNFTAQYKTITAFNDITSAMQMELSEDAPRGMSSWFVRYSHEINGLFDLVEYVRRYDLEVEEQERRNISEQRIYLWRERVERQTIVSEWFTQTGGLRNPFVAKLTAIRQQEALVHWSRNSAQLAASGAAFAVNWSHRLAADANCILAGCGMAMVGAALSTAAGRQKSQTFSSEQPRPVLPVDPPTLAMTYLRKATELANPTSSPADRHNAAVVRGLVGHYLPQLQPALVLQRVGRRHVGTKGIRAAFLAKCKAERARLLAENTAANRLQNRQRQKFAVEDIKRLRQQRRLERLKKDPKNAPLLDLFDVYANHSDGRIHAAELPTLIRYLGYNPTEDEISSIMAKYDSNCDGTLDFPEFVALIEAEKSSVKPMPSKDEVSQAFAVLSDGEQGMDLETIKSALMTEGDPLDEEEVNALLDLADEDVDFSSAATTPTTTSARQQQTVAETADNRSNDHDDGGASEAKKRNGVKLTPLSQSTENESIVAKGNPSSITPSTTMEGIAADESLILENSVLDMSLNAQSLRRNTTVAKERAFVDELLKSPTAGDSSPHNISASGSSSPLGILKHKGSFASPVKALSGSKSTKPLKQQAWNYSSPNLRKPSLGSSSLGSPLVASPKLNPKPQANLSDLPVLKSGTNVLSPVKRGLPARSSSVVHRHDELSPVLVKRSKSVVATKTSSSSPLGRNQLSRSGSKVQPMAKRSQSSMEIKSVDVRTSSSSTLPALKQASNLAAGGEGRSRSPSPITPAWAS